MFKKFPRRADGTLKKPSVFALAVIMLFGGWLAHSTQAFADEAPASYSNPSGVADLQCANHTVSATVSNEPVDGNQGTLQDVEFVITFHPNQGDDVTLDIVHLPGKDNQYTFTKDYIFGEQLPQPEASSGVVVISTADSVVLDQSENTSTCIGDTGQPPTDDPSGTVDPPQVEHGHTGKAPQGNAVPNTGA